MIFWLLIINKSINYSFIRKNHEKKPNKNNIWLLRMFYFDLNACLFFPCDTEYLYIFRFKSIVSRWPSCQWYVLFICVEIKNVENITNGKYIVVVPMFIRENVRMYWLFVL